MFRSVAHCICWMVVGAGLFTVSACSSSVPKKEAHQNTSKTESKKKIVTPPSEPALTDEETYLCAMLDSGVNYVLLNHLEYGPDDKAEVMRAGFDLWSKAWVEDKEVTFKLDQTNSETVCKSFLVLSNYLFNIDAEKAENKLDPMSYHTFQVNVWLRRILKSMDPFSDVVFEERGEESYTGFSLPLPLYHRSDYNWRNPDYLVVDPSYNGGLNKSIKPWSVITGINDIEIPKNTFSNLRNKLFNNMEKENSITFTLPGGSAPQTIHVASTEMDVDLPYVLSHTVDEQTIYVKILNVDNESNHNLWYSLLAQAGDKNVNVILDVRGNPGGAVTFAKKIVSYFLPPKSSQFVFERSAYNPETQKKEYVQSLEAYTDYYKEPVWKRFGKILILMDRTSASSSELIVSALQSNQRVFVIGERSFGKFIGQSHYSKNAVNDHWLRPIVLTQLRSFGFRQDENGNWTYSAWADGLVPDAVVVDPVLEYLEKNKDKLEEPYYLFHMSDYDFRLSDQPRTPIEFKPEILVPMGMRVLPDEKAWLVQQTAAIAKETPSCFASTLPGSALFREEDECIYQVGIKLMKIWHTAAQPN